MTARTAPAPWMAPAVSWTAGGVGASALVVSAVELYLLATALHFHPLVAVALFVGVDLGAASGAIMRVGSSKGSPMARAGRVTTWCLVLASSALNGTSVLARPDVVAAQTPVGQLAYGQATGVAFAIAVLFPVVAALMVELVLLAHAVPAAVPTRSRPVPARQEPARKQEEAPPAPAASVPSPSPVGESGTRTLQAVPAPHAPPPAPVPVPAVKAPTKQERAEEEWKRTYRDTGEYMTPAAINRAVEANGLVKTKHLERWKEEVDAEPAANTS